MKLEIPVNPVPASRPRVTRWGTYFAKTYRQYREDAKRALPPADVPLEGPLAVSMVFTVRRPKSTKLAHPKPDIDNFAKAALDVLTTQGYWQDDHQVIRLRCSKEWAEPGEPGMTRIEIKPA